jgi:hypothetical protein
LAGGSIVIQNDATIDVSGGYLQHEGGMVETSRLLQQGRLVDIADARPDQEYDGIFTGRFVVNHERYGISEVYKVPFLTGARFEAGYTEGAAGGALAITAPSMAIDGELLGVTVEGPRQRADRAAHSRLSLTFEAERINPINQSFGKISPIAPTVVLNSVTELSTVGAFTLNGRTTMGIGEEREQLVALSPELLKEHGFGHLSVVNPDGAVLVPAAVSIEAPARGSISLTGSNVTIAGDVSAPSGELTFRALNLSPSFVEDFRARAQTETPLSNPPPDASRGRFTLTRDAKLDAAGLLVDDRSGSANSLSQPLALGGGNIVIEAFDVRLRPGSSLDVSGGARLGGTGQVSFGNGGRMSILAGRDTTITSVGGGELQLDATLRGYSGTKGGSLALRAMTIQVGGAPHSQNTLLLTPDFFRQGGFTEYSLTGIGALAADPAPEGRPEAYLPAVSVAEGTKVSPLAESWLALPNAGGPDGFELQTLLRPSGCDRPPASA